jgi:REP element-mobilizing transposase RayT
VSIKYKATSIGEAYFITITTVGWIDIFTRLRQKHVIIKAIKHSQKERNLEVYAYCLMSSHLHMLCKVGEKESLSTVMRDFKKYTPRFRKIVSCGR